jgi:hypothetical protein
MRCSKCGSADLRRLRATGFLAAFMQLLDRLPCRCRSCRSRSYWRREVIRVTLAC